MRATDWKQTDTLVGSDIGADPWHFHHIFPDETFDGERAILRDKIEEAQSNGDNDTVTKLEEERKSLENSIVSVPNLAFLTPKTNQSISNRSPIDYLRELSSTAEGKKALEDQLIPIEPELWKHSSFAAFRKKRSELIADKARELFFKRTQY